MSVLEQIARVLIFVAAAPAILFPVMYALWSPWTSTDEGRAIMMLGSACGLIFALILANIFWGHGYFGRDYIRVGAYSFLAYAFWRLLFVLRRVQLRARRGHYDHAVPADS